MEHRDETRPQTAATRGRGPGAVVHDRDWPRSLRSSARCAAGLLGMLLLIDRAAGTLSGWRCVLWVTLALLLFLVLLPARVSAGEGWLAARRPLRTRRVRTDMLVAARPLEGVCPRLILRDAFGVRVEIDPDVLIRNPELWYRLDEGIRRSEAAGTLLSGTTALHRLARRVDRETALTVFRSSGLE
ncbi:hypothetical protein ACIPRD_15045 [Streptomyces sp. NPDC090108]|uniref:hypothetical protein n=1 Tax=Streptomyces sp. NPDC090108 TaxID=3365947 RepID=UPI0038101B6A